MKEKVPSLLIVNKEEIMDLELKGKNVLITGSSDGLGKAMALSFAKEGANVIITGRSEKKVNNVVDMIRNTYSVSVASIICDLSNKENAISLFDLCLETVGGIDILVNNAGLWPQSLVQDMDESDFERVLFLNLEVPFILSKRMVRYLLQSKKKGKIINVVSQAAFHGSTTGHAHYAASKGGLVSFMISLAREVAPYGINVNAIAPGMMQTNMVGKAIEAKREYYEGRIPIGRVAMPEEIADIAVFLGSKKADYLTGITIDATGGMLMR